MTILFREPSRLLENIMRKLGSILKNSMTIYPDCFVNSTLNGKCAGTRTGAALNYILYIS
jgi:hypothetical protein